MSHDIQDFVTRGGQRVTPAAIVRLEQELPLVLAKLTTADPPQQPHLLDQAQFLVRFVEDCLENHYSPADLAALTESIFALIYLHKGTDIIPDEIPEIGYEDDSAVMRAVLLGHRAEFARFAGHNGMPVPLPSVEP
ncbi:MAG TPA: YkvA family protein [Chthoniobacterales bacterium]|jgi:hypothetical protein